MKVYRGIEELVGGTPLIELARYARAHALEALIYAKLESFNPAGSVKARAALSMLEDAERRGALRPGATVVEPTSGNTGIALAAIGVPRGYRVVLTMPETMSVERRALLEAYGAEIVLTEGAKGMPGAIEKAREIAEATPGCFMPGQFENPMNPAAHRLTTGPEIWRDARGQVDVFVAGVGTGGTVSGAGGYLKQMNPAVRVVAVEPARSPVLSGGAPGPHGLQGIGAGFVPDALDTHVYDEIMQATEADAYAAARALARNEGVLAGISSGAALWAATELARRPEIKGKRIVVVLPDTGERYLSTPLFTGEK